MLKSGWLILILICVIIGSVLYKLNKNRETTIHFTPKINRLMTGYCFNFLSKSQCKFIIDSAEKHIWTKKRHKYFPTVDQQVKTLPELNFLSDKVTNELFPKISDLYTFKKCITNFKIRTWDSNLKGKNPAGIFPYNYIQVLIFARRYFSSIKKADLIFATNSGCKL